MNDNLDWADGQKSIPGIRPIVYGIAKNKITTWPTFAAAPATASAKVTYVGSFVLEALATWKRINVITDKSPVEAESQGETRCKSFLNKATFVTALTEEKATAFAMDANNDDLVYLVQEKEGKYRVLGNEMFNTVTSVNLKIGDAPTGEKGITINVEVSDAMPAPFYIGAIVTDDGTINP